MPSSRASRKRANSKESPAPPKRARNQTRPVARRGGKAAASERPVTPSPSKTPVAAPRKPTLFDDLDSVAADSPSSARSHPERQHLEKLDDDDDDDSSLTSLTDQEFEDVLVEPAPVNEKKKAVDDSSSEDDSDEDMEFEDVVPASLPLLSLSSLADDNEQGPAPSGDLELTLHKDTRVSLTNPYGEKKGPSKVERLVRNATHCVHVQTLLWHNARRNAWISDPLVQGILLSYLPTQLWDEVTRWRQASGLEKPPPPRKRGVQSKARGKSTSTAAKRLEEGAVDRSHGDPLFRLVRVLSAWWRKKFRVTAPGLRKVGYLSLERLDRLMKEYKAHPERFGERISSLAGFRMRAQQLCGSRDVGAQLFTALLRGFGMEARMVASLQPLGFGWNKMEDADPETAESTGETTPPTPKASRKAPVQADAGPSRKRASVKAEAIVIEDSDEDLDLDLELAEVNSDNDSVVVVPEDPVLSGPQRPVYDKDLQYPHYWTEILSPVTQKYLPVDVLVKNVLATNRELVESLEPRGAKADKARQVMAYVVGFSPDGTAKDVTVRYLKRQMLPGRTKGARFPIEKVPVYDKYGKVKRYNLVDWFRLVMRGYVRGQRKENPLTEADEAEDATDLRPAQAEKKVVKEGEETLQYYKQSKEFVLERHLKREEALVEGARPVKVFRNTKGKASSRGGAAAEEENVYLRKDVVAVKSAETWHKQGRAPVAGTQPLKRVPYRAATINRRREIAEAEAATGAPVLQGLYSREQTDWIIPPPIRNGVIPKNEYGNIDLFVEHMCPAGAVHVPYRGAARVCRRLDVDYAEAVVDFEFGHRMAVPVIQGVVVAAEQEARVLEELARDEAERKRREDQKRRAAALSLWRKMLMGLRIVERIRQDYGDVREDERVFGSGRHEVDLDREDPEVPEDMAGGFLPPGFEPAEDVRGHSHVSSFFPVDDGDDESAEGGFIVEDGEAGQMEE